MMEDNLIAQYDVYVSDDTECVHDYIGDDFDAAVRSFELLKSLHINPSEPIKKEIDIILYDNYNEKIVMDYNTLKDA